jgi:serine/threonine protein kinase
MLAAYHRLEECSEFINQVIEAVLTPKTLYLIMPKHFGNVHAYILEKPLGEAEAANLFLQMLKIVQHCHDNGVILRDIKMGRFVFVDKDKMKIKLESLEDATLLVDPSNDNLDDNYGCPNYVSPEKAETLLTKLRYPGKASDIWCLGVILYTMLSGRYPFNDPNQSKLLNKIRAGNFTIPPGLSSSVSFLIKTLLRKSPAERPSCKEILKSSWLSKHCVSTTFFTSEANTDPKESNETSDITEVPHKYAVHSQLVNDQVVPNF